MNQCGCSENSYGKKYYIENNYGKKYIEEYKEENVEMNCGYNGMETADYGDRPYVTDVMRDAMENRNFRTAIWTGKRLQMTLMCIPVNQDIGMEMHEDTDQIFRIESGVGMVCMGAGKERMERNQKVSVGDVVFVPMGTWHNMINIGDTPLKLSSVYAPPNHRKGTVDVTKEDAAHHMH